MFIPTSHVYQPLTADTPAEDDELAVPRKPLIVGWLVPNLVAGGNVREIDHHLLLEWIVPVDVEYSVVRSYSTCHMGPGESGLKIGDVGVVIELVPRYRYRTYTPFGKLLRRYERLDIDDTAVRHCRGEG